MFSLLSGGLVTNSYPTLEIPWTVAHQAPLSIEFSRQEYWSGLPFPSPGGLPDPGIEPGSPALQVLYRLNHKGSLKSLKSEWVVITGWKTVQVIDYFCFRVELRSRMTYPCPPPGDLPDPGIKLRSPALQAGASPLSHQ